MSGFVAIAGSDGDFEAWTEAPSSPRAGVVVIQEIFGTTPFVRGIAAEFCAEGYHAAAPDLFWRDEPRIVLDGGIAADVERAMALNVGLDEEAALRDCEDTVSAIRVMLGADAPVGAVGFCLGGRLAYLLACRAPIQAAVGYYGVGIERRLDELGSLRSPLLLHLAGEDHLCPPDAQAAICEAAKRTGGLAEVFVYPGAKHGFARVGGPNHDAAATALARERTMAFLARTLG